MRTEDEIQADAADESPFSNGTEYEIWSDGYCGRCVHDNPGRNQFCPILGVAILGSWPTEWTRATHTWEIGDKSGSYEVVDTCTEFEERRRGGRGGDGPPKPKPPVVECDGQLDIVDAYLDTALAELTPQPSEAVTA